MKSTKAYGRLPNSHPATTFSLVGLAVSFFKVGLVGFGGGPSFIPLIQQEVVSVRRWFTREQFLDAFAFGNTLPGPIATKLAGYVGYRVAGWPGALVALLALTVPTILAMIFLASLYVRYQDHPAASSFLVGVRPVVIALLIMVVAEFAPSALGKPSQWLHNWSLWLLAAAAFVLAVGFGIHPAVLIIAGGLIGIFLSR
jgi:chromate transporter